MELYGTFEQNGVFFSIQLMEKRKPNIFFDPEGGEI